MSELESGNLEDNTSDAAQKKPEREGLPTGYRMRADAHYVDVLTRRSDRVQGDSPRASRKAEAQAFESDADINGKRDSRDRTDRLLAQLAEDVLTIESAAGVLAGDGSRLSRRVNVDVVRAQAARAGWLLRANAILEGTHRVQMRPRPLAFLLGHVRSTLAPDFRLNGIRLEVQASDWGAVVPVDESGILAALTGAVVATLGLIGQGEDTVLTLTATVANGELRVDLAQDEVIVSEAVSTRFFDSGWNDRPGGWLAGLGASVARAVAQQHGGDAVFLMGERGGSALRMNFSRAAG